MNILASIVIALAVFGVGLGTGIRWEKGREAIENKHIAEAVDAANAAAAEAISKIKVTNKTVMNEVQHEVRTNTVYSDATCAHTDNGLLSINKALAPPGPAGDRKLPGPDAPK